MNVGSHHTEANKRRWSKARRGKKNIMYGKHHTPEARAKIREAALGRKASAETRAKMSKAHREHPGSGFSGRRHTKASKKQIAEVNRFKIDRALTASKFHESSTERRLHAALQRLKIQFKKHFPLLNRWVGDVFLPKYNLVLEADGGWHTVPKNKAKDQKRDEAICAAGFNVVRIPNKQIEADPVIAVKLVLSQNGIEI